MNKRALYFLTPGHNNAGDNLQTYCIRKMLSGFYETVLEFNFSHTSKGLRQVRENDIIFLSSGGNMGDLYLGGERGGRALSDLERVHCLCQGKPE